MVLKLGALLWTMLIGLGCTSIEVQPLPAGVDRVVIVDNPKVLVDDFVPVLREALERRGIQTFLVRDEPSDPVLVSATYTALRSWDLGAYLSSADVVFRRGGLQIANVHYHLAAGGGFSLTKWGSVESKMTPAYDRLLEAYAERGEP